MKAKQKQNALGAVPPNLHVHKMHLVPLFCSTSAIRNEEAMFCPITRVNVIHRCISHQ
jgi:hypothetical protein